MPTARVPSQPGTGPSPVAIWAGIWVLYLVWGSTYLGIRVAIETMPPFLMAAVRFLMAGMMLLGWSLLRHHAQRPSRRAVLDAAIVGALLLGGGMGLVAYGERSVPSGIAALLVAMMPLWVAVFGRLAFGERLPLAAGVGIVVGLVGVAILVSPGGGALDRVDPIDFGAILVSPICWASGSLYAAHRATMPPHPLTATGLQMLLGSVVLAGMAVATGEPAGFDPATVSAASLAALAYLTLVGSIVAFTTYGWLLRVASLPKVATYAYVNPVVAVILGWLILGEAISERTILAAVVIVAGVALIVTARGRLQTSGATLETPAEATRLLLEELPEPVPGGFAAGTGGMRASAGDRGVGVGDPGPDTGDGRASAESLLPAEGPAAAGGSIRARRAVPETRSDG